MQYPTIEEIRKFVEKAGLAFERVRIDSGKYEFSIGRYDTSGNYDEFVRFRSAFAMKKLFAYIMK